MTTTWPVVVYVSVLGALIGSFLNVVIWRVPRGESVVRPPSRCPRCGHQLRAFENVPVFAWIGLRGKCRSCRLPISPRYPLVEAATAATFGWLAHVVGVRHEQYGLLAASLVMASGLIASIGVAADTGRLHPRIAGVSAALTLLCAPLALLDGGDVGARVVRGVVGAGVGLAVAVALCASGRSEDRNAPEIWSRSALAVAAGLVLGFLDGISGAVSLCAVILPTAVVALATRFRKGSVSTVLALFVMILLIPAF